MFARVARYRIPAERIGEVAQTFGPPLEQVREIEGNNGGYLLIDRDNSMAVTVTFWENQALMEASEVRASRLRSEAINSVDGSIESVDSCDVALDLSAQARV